MVLQVRHIDGSGVEQCTILMQHFYLKAHINRLAKIGITKYTVLSSKGADIFADERKELQSLKDFEAVKTRS